MLKRFWLTLEMSLDGGFEPWFQSGAVRFESHGLEDDAGEDRVTSDESDNTEDEDDAAQDEGDETTVAGALLETTTCNQDYSDQFRIGKTK